MRVLVTGSLFYISFDIIRNELSKLPTGTTIVVGNRPGAELAAAKIAEEDLNMEVEIWNVNEDCSEADLFSRNTDMINTDIDMCIAFVLSKDNFVTDCIKKARSRHIETIVV